LSLNNTIQADEPLILDHSMRQSYSNCHRKFLARYICGLHLWSPINKAGLDFGKAFHLCTEAFDHTQDFQQAFGLFVDNYECGPYEKKRTPERAQELLNLYADWAQLNKVTFKPHEIEVPFMVPLTDKVVHAGRIDRVRSDENGVIPWEFKTTLRLYEKGTPDKYLRSWEAHNQTIGYAAPWSAPSVRLLAFGVEKTPKTTYPTTGDGMEVRDIEIQPWELEDWRISTLSIALEIRQKLKSWGHLSPSLANPEETLKQVLTERLHLQWERNTGNCFSWNSACPYLDLCTRDWPRGLVEQDYYVDGWKPYMGFVDGKVEEGEVTDA